VFHAIAQAALQAAVNAVRSAADAFEAMSMPQPDNIAALPDRRTPDQRATDLLKAHFPENTWHMHSCGRSYFTVLGSRSQHRYHLFPGGGVYAQNFGGYCIQGFLQQARYSSCGIYLRVVTDYDIPKDDTILACALLIKYDEQAFLRIANPR
jgi:hypothetical protein